MEADGVKALEESLKTNGSYTVEGDGKSFTLTKEMVSVREQEKTLHVEELVPSVIEPSFGIGRILYGVLEHSFRQRENDEQRTVSISRHDNCVID